MNKFFWIFLGSSASCLAILPPAWEGVREIKSILEDKQLSRYLESGDVIEKIEHQESGWKIVTNHSEIDVEVEKMPQDLPGPEAFKLNFKLLPPQSGTSPH